MNRPNRPVSAVLNLEAIAASTPYVLVDLSDVTNFPHSKTGAIHLLGLILSTEKASDGIFDVFIGVVTENDGTDGTAEWAMCFHIEAIGNPTDNTDRLITEIDFTRGGSIVDGLDLTVHSDATPYLVTNIEQADSANWKNDTARTCPAGTANPGVGDLVMLIEEVTDGGTLDLCINVQYEAI